MSDLIKRQDAIRIVDSIDTWQAGWRGDAIESMKALPSAQPEMNLDEWCTDCKEYDHKRHCCPRWNRVIRTTLKDMPEIIRCKDCAKREFCRTSTVWAVRPGDDWFCADAERREDG